MREVIKSILTKYKTVSYVQFFEKSKDFYVYAVKSVSLLCFEKI